MIHYTFSLEHSETFDILLALLSLISAKLSTLKQVWFLGLPCTWMGCWCGVVCDAFRMKRSYSTPGLVSTAMGDCLPAGKPSRCEACQLGLLSLLPSVGW